MPKPKSLAGPRRLRHRRRRRHRLGHRFEAAVGRRLRGAGRHRPGLARRGHGGLRQDLWQGQCPRRDHGRHQRGRRHRAQWTRPRWPLAASTSSSTMPASPSAAPVEDTTLDLWNKNMAILGTGYFLVGREGYRLLKRQKLGGSMVFICSKNGVAASPGASAYCAVKAAEIHLARCMALEGAPHGIRVNVVNPDAVLRGSKIWQGAVAPAARRLAQDHARTNSRNITASARCCSARSIRRTSPRASISSPPISPTSRPAISSTSMRAMPRPSRGSR